jgi:hypothetical protein
VFTSKVEVLIARPLDEVFEFVADVRNRPRWDDSVDSEELTSPEPIGVGSTVRTKLRSARTTSTRGRSWSTSHRGG